jgi:hypothetical protein
LVGIAASIYIILAIVAVIRPKIGAYGLWATSWLYPIGLLHALLPLNIRFDDLYLLWVTLVVFISSAGKYSPKSRVLLLSVLWFLAILLGNIVGLLTGPAGLIWRTTLARVGKSLYIPLVGYCIWKTCENEEDIKGHLIGIMIGGMGASVIGIMQVKVPHLVIMWEIPRYLYEATYKVEVWGEIIRRAGGSMGVQYFAVTTMALVIIAARFLTSRGSGKIRLFSIIGLPFFGVGLLFSNTRGPMAGAVLGLFYMLIRQRKRFLLLFAIVIFLTYVIVGTNLPERILQRFTGRQIDVETSLESRSEIWKLYLSHFSIQYFFFGRGFIPEYQRLGFTAHSSYIGAIAYTGLIGAVITAMLLFNVWRQARLVKMSIQTSFSSLLANCITPVLIGTLFASIFNEFLQSHHMRLVVALGVLAERCVWLQRKEEVYFGQGYLEMDPYISEDAVVTTLPETEQGYDWRS